MEVVDGTESSSTTDVDEESASDRLLNDPYTRESGRHAALPAAISRDIESHAARTISGAAIPPLQVQQPATTSSTQESQFDEQQFPTSLRASLASPGTGSQELPPASPATSGSAESESHSAGATKADEGNVDFAQSRTNFRSPSLNEQAIIEDVGGSPDPHENAAEIQGESDASLKSIGAAGLESVIPSSTEPANLDLDTSSEALLTVEPTAQNGFKDYENSTEFAQTRSLQASDITTSSLPVDTQVPQEDMSASSEPNEIASQDANDGEGLLNSSRPSDAVEPKSGPENTRWLRSHATQNPLTSEPSNFDDLENGEDTSAKGPKKRGKRSATSKLSSAQIMDAVFLTYPDVGLNNEALRASSRQDYSDPMTFCTTIPKGVLLGEGKLTPKKVAAMEVDRDNLLTTHWTLNKDCVAAFELSERKGIDVIRVLCELPFGSGKSDVLTALRTSYRWNNASLHQRRLRVFWQLSYIIVAKAESKETVASSTPVWSSMRLTQHSMQPL